MSRLVRVTHRLFRSTVGARVPEDQMAACAGMGRYIDLHNANAEEYDRFLVRDTGEGTVAAINELRLWDSHGTVIDIQELPSGGGSIGIYGVVNRQRAFAVTVTVADDAGGVYLEAFPTYCDPVLVRECGPRLSVIDYALDGALEARMRSLCRGETHIGIPRALAAVLLSHAATAQKLANYHLQHRAAALGELVELARVHALELE